ncbi:MAG TPA: DUF2497 domain-containing protein [Alphaproteobacteria bacterium]
MTDAKNQQAEPSMEEILASIRRIISEDADAGKGPAPAADSAVAEASSAPANDPPKAAAADVLELTEMVGDDGKVTDLKSRANPETPPEPRRSEPSSVQSTPVTGLSEQLVSEQAASAAASALSGLRAVRSREIASVRLGNGGATLEEIVRSELRPLLKAWLDENLPSVVERIVEREIDRITRQVDRA